MSEEDICGSLQRSEKRKEERQKKADQVAALAIEIWRQANQARDDNPYLARKQERPTDTLRQIELSELMKQIGYRPQAHGEPLVDGPILIAPVMTDGKFSTLEMIDGEGRKSALAGGKKSGGFWATGKLPEGTGEDLRIAIGEGIATCLTATKATGNLTVAALSCGNILAVARQIRERYPKAEITLLAELNKKTGNTKLFMQVPDADTARARFSASRGRTKIFSDHFHWRSPVGQENRGDPDQTNRIPQHGPRYHLL